MYSYRSPYVCIEVFDLILVIDTLNDKRRPFTWKGNDTVLVSLPYNEYLKLAVWLQ
jgi:hypothetical protein